MIAALVANFPDKPVRFSAILGLFTPILITFFPWQILQKNIILGFLYSLVSSGMIFAGLIDATKYNCCHQEIYNYLDNISMFVFGKEGFYFEKNLTKYIFYIKINSSLFQFF